MSIYRSSPKGQPLHQRNSSELSNDAKSPKGAIYLLLSNSQFYYNYSTQLLYVHESNLPTLLTYSGSIFHTHTPPTTPPPRIQLNLLSSPTLQPTFIRYQSPVKPSHTPLEAGISVKTTVDALTAQSVQPEGSHLPKVGGWNPGHRSTLK